MNRNLAILLLSTAATLSGPALAEQVQRADGEQGSYAVHYNALTTDRLTPTIARAYDLRRSSAVALVNIAVLREQVGTTGTPVHARVTITITNLAGQPKSMTAVREVTEGEAIYYLATTGIAAHETLDFRIEVVPEGETRPIRFRFTRAFD
jgi:uncharacterized protein DUF4426